MKICIIQTHSKKGNIKGNIESHLNLIKLTISHSPDLIVFPELSITNYEPKLAHKLARHSDDSVFSAFQKITDQMNCSITIGLPLLSESGVHIAMIIFRPHQIRSTYCKQYLHPDELKYFKPRASESILKIKNENIGLAICYESTHLKHIQDTMQKEVNAYIISAAKDQKGFNSSSEDYAKIAFSNKVPVVLSNSIGQCEDFTAIGKSSVWNSKGDLIAQLDDLNEGFIVFDTDTELTEVSQWTITLGQTDEVEEVFDIYLAAKEYLANQGIHQWVDSYPTRKIIEEDLIKGALHVLKNGSKIVGAVNLSKEQEIQYQEINWHFDDSKVLVIHRLVVHPTFQGQGLGIKLMQYSEGYAIDNNYTSIRLDAYSQNQKVLEFYKKRDYHFRGRIRFPKREFPFHCFEKEIK